MSLKMNRAVLLAAGVLLATSACGGNAAVPGSSAGAGNAGQFLSRITDDASPADTTSILKKLTKNVVIGSTVDPKNGDMGPHGLSVVKSTFGLKKGQLVTCNFADSTGAAGKGTTIEVLNPSPGSSPANFVTSTKIQGCDSDTVTTNDSVVAAGQTSGLLVEFNHNGKLTQTWGSPFAQPFGAVDASNPGLYSAEYIFGSDSKTGGIVSFSINYYGNPKPIEVANGFAVNKKTGWSTLGPSGVQYFPKKDELFIADGVTNTVVYFTHAGELLVKDEITVNPDGKTFSCKYPKTTCGKLVLAGSPLNAPVAMTLLPNGNLIVANTKGGNTLVEMTPTGQVLDTEVVDKSKTAGIFGIAATGKTDDNTVLFYTDANDNSIHELEP